MNQSASKSLTLLKWIGTGTGVSGALLVALIMQQHPTSTQGDAVRFLTDFISGMTDGYTLRLFQKLHLGLS